MTEKDDKSNIEEKIAKRKITELASSLALSPDYNAAVAIESYSKMFGDQSVIQLAKDLQEQIKLVNNGDLGRAEAILVGQSHALQTIFANLSRRAMNAEYIDSLERYLRLALKAQAQCARTIEVLGNLKNPAPFTLVKQANIGQAVQVNNGGGITAPSESQPRAQEKLNPANELLEVKDGQRLDSGTTGTTIRSNTQLEPLEQINRTENHGRKNTGKQKRL